MTCHCGSVQESTLGPSQGILPLEHWEFIRWLLDQVDLSKCSRQNAERQLVLKGRGWQSSVYHRGLLLILAGTEVFLNFRGEALWSTQSRAGRSDQQHCSSPGCSRAAEVSERQNSFTHYHSPLKGMKTPQRTKPPHQNVGWKDKTTQKPFAQTGTHYQASSDKAVSSSLPSLYRTFFALKEPFRSMEYTPGRAEAAEWSLREEENQSLLQPTASQPSWASGHSGKCHHSSFEALGAAGCINPSNLVPPRGPPCILALHLNTEGTPCIMASLLSNALSPTIFPKSSKKRSFPKVSLLRNSLDIDLNKATLFPSMLWCSFVQPDLPQASLGMSFLLMKQPDCWKCRNLDAFTEHHWQHKNAFPISTEYLPPVRWREEMFHTSPQLWNNLKAKKILSWQNPGILGAQKFLGKTINPACFILWQWGTAIA